MKLSIMQPYFMPYIGYFQLMNAVDEFVIYDNIKYTKKGWFNRNRILDNGKDSYITVPLKKASDYLDVRDRWLADTWVVDRKKLLKRIIESYRKAPNFSYVYPIIEKCIFFEEFNLFKFILNSINIIKEFLEIKTLFHISSTIPIEHSLKSEKKVIEICKDRNASTYVNPIGGSNLYKKENFKNQRIDLKFLKTNDFKYKQLNSDFVPMLSIIDIMMFITKDEIKRKLDLYTLE